MNDIGINYSFSSERCQYREFGVNFFEQYPLLTKDIERYDVVYLMSNLYDKRGALSSAIQQLPEYLAFLKNILKNDFFFAAFDQSCTENEKLVKKTGPRDVEKFILERIKSQTAQPRINYEFVVETEGKIIGYAELFDIKIVEGRRQCEWGVFINPERQGNDYGKEAIIAPIDYAFKTLNIDRVFVTVDPENIRSLNNIVRNSGGTYIGDMKSQYGHLSGGGAKRSLFYIYPSNFYSAVHSKGNAWCLRKDDVPVTKTPSMAALGGT